MTSGDRWLSLLAALYLCAAPPRALQTTLLEAAQQGSVEKVIEFLNGEVHVESKNKDGDTALVLAAREGHTRVAEVLLEHDASLDAVNNAGDTPVIVAALRGHLRMVELFVRKEVDLAAANKAGDTALILAVQYRRTDVAKLLIRTIQDEEILNARNKDGRSALYWASRNGDVELEKILRARGAT